VYLFNFALLPIGRQGMADFSSDLRLLPLAAGFANCTPTAGKFTNTSQPLIKKISAASRSSLSLLN
jgi:hypothetical protein